MTGLTESALRDRIAMEMAVAIYHEMREDARHDEVAIPPDWRMGISQDAYKMADTMLKARKVFCE